MRFLSSLYSLFAPLALLMAILFSLSLPVLAMPAKSEPPFVAHPVSMARGAPVDAVMFRAEISSVLKNRSTLRQVRGTIIPN